MASQKIGALWKRTSNGKTFLSGVIQDLRGDIQIAVFINDRKEKDNQPDFNIVRSEQKEEKKQQQYDDFDFGQEGQLPPDNSIIPNDEEPINVPF